MSKIACIGNSTKDCLSHTKNNSPIICDGRNDLSVETISVGGPANNASFVINKFGNETHLIGQVGDDEYGKYITSQMKKEGINISKLYICPELITPHSTIILSSNAKKSDSQRTIFTCRDEKDKEIFCDFDFESNQFDAIHTDGKYLKESQKLIEANPNALKFIDAGRVNDGVVDLCRNVDYLVCSEDFAIGYLRKRGYHIENDRININDITEYTKLYNNLVNEFHNDKIVVTIGKYGCLYKNENGYIEILPTLDNLNVVDVNAAGDIFHGAFVHAITNGMSYREALIFSNITASLSTTRVGGRASCPSLEEVNKIFNDFSKNSYCTKVLKRKK